MHRFRINGLLYDFGTMRTYGYPLFLTPLTYISGFSQERLFITASAVQSALYGAAALWVSVKMRLIGGCWSLATLLTVLFNPVALALVTDTLTDGLSFTLVIALTALALDLARPYGLWRTRAEKDTDTAIAIARILRRQLLHPLDHGASFAALRPW
jgi:hypothetical protein